MVAVYSEDETDEFVHIHVNGETISATPSHPFYVYKFGWTLAGSLKAGDVLVLSNGELVTVEWVQHELLESPIKVYNFEVEDFHTYFVGECEVLVHNVCETGSYKELSHNGKPGQAHHVGQDAAFGKVIDHDDALCVKLVGNIRLDKSGSTPHYKAHKTMEQFWDKYRKGGKYFGSKPTIQQYNKAAYKSLINAGISSTDAREVIKSCSNNKNSMVFTEIAGCQEYQIKCGL